MPPAVHIYISLDGILMLTRSPPRSTTSWFIVATIGTTVTSWHKSISTKQPTHATSLTTTISEPQKPPVPSVAVNQTKSHRLLLITEARLQWEMSNTILLTTLPTTTHTRYYRTFHALIQLVDWLYTKGKRSTTTMDSSLALFLFRSYRIRKSLLETLSTASNTTTTEQPLFTMTLATLFSLLSNICQKKNY
jgi:hypothetical protein